MPMGIGPGLSVTRFESGIPGWMAGMDLGWDFTQNVQYSGATNPTDTHSATIYAQSAAGVWSPFAANTLVQTDLGLQTVPTYQNFVTAPNDLSDAAWTKSACTIAANSAIGPFGTSTMDKIQEDNTFANHQVVNNAWTTAVSGQNYCIYGYIRSGERSVARVNPSGAAAPINTACWFNASTGIATKGSAAVSASMRQVSSGIWYCEMVLTASSAASLGFQLGTAIVSGDFSYVGTTGFGLYAEGWNLRQGSFGLPPMTSAATVTGNQQVVDLTGRLSSGVGGIVQVNLLEPYASVANRIVEFSDGTGNNSCRLSLLNSTTISAEMTTGGISQGIVSAIVPTYPAVMTLAYAFGTNYIRMQAVGQAAPASDTTATLPTMSSMGIMGRGFDAIRNTYGITRRSAIALRGGWTDAMFNELVAKATILNAVS